MNKTGLSRMDSFPGEVTQPYLLFHLLSGGLLLKERILFLMEILILLFYLHLIQKIILKSYNR